MTEKELQEEVVAILEAYRKDVKRKLTTQCERGVHLSQPQTIQELTEVFKKYTEAVIGEDFKPSYLDGDKRWTRNLPPNTTQFVTEQHAKAANEEFADMRAKLTKENTNNE